MSSRFFNLVSEATLMTPSQNSDGKRHVLRENKTRNMMEVFNFVRLGWNALENFCDRPLNKEDNDEQLSITNAKKKCDAVYMMVGDIKGERESTTETIAISGIACLLTSLFLLLLKPGSPEDIKENDMEEAEEELSNDVDEKVHELISDLFYIAEAIDKNRLFTDSQELEKCNESKNITSLAAVCVDIFSSPLDGNYYKNNPSCGAAWKLVRDCVKTVWVGCLNVKNTKSLPLNTDAMDIIIRSVCDSKAMTDINEDTDLNSTDDEDEDEDEFHFTDQVDSINAPEGHSSIKEIDADSDTEGEEESDTEEDLEHHVGADAALAQLIKLKQESRKSQKNKLEKIKLVHRLRCIALLEFLFTRSSVFSHKLVFMSILPLLRARKELDKSITNITVSLSEGKKNTGSSLSEKRSLLSRISTLLEFKIPKSNMNDEPDIKICKDLATHLMNEMKMCDTSSHHSCCSKLFIFVVKAVSRDFDESIALVQDNLVVAMKEWSTKRTSKLSSSVFVDLINKFPRIARIVLIDPLIIAAKDARSPFLKSESFRMIALLYNNVVNDNGEENKAERTALDKAIPNIATAIVDVLVKGNLRNKRVRDVLKAAERLVIYCQNRKCKELWNGLYVLQELESLDENVNNPGLLNAFEKVRKKISDNCPKM